MLWVVLTQRMPCFKEHPHCSTAGPGAAPSASVPHQPAVRPHLSCPQYAEMEMRHRFVNHARNIWDRAVSLLPRIDQLWYKVGG